MNNILIILLIIVIGLSTLFVLIANYKKIKEIGGTIESKKYILYISLPVLYVGITFLLTFLL